MKTKAEKIRILFFVDRFGRGGIQALLANIAQTIDRASFDVEFLVLDDGEYYSLEDEIRNMGFKVHKLNGIWLRNPFDYPRYKRALKAFFAENDKYDLVHLHSSSKNFQVLRYAKKAGIQVRIAHAHSTSFHSENKIRKIVGSIFKYQLKRYSTDWFACSAEAGRWLFGSQFDYHDRRYVLKNAVDVESLCFDQKRRESKRSELGIDDDCMLIGNVARLEWVKNQDRLIDIVRCAREINDDIRLLIVGEGSLREELDAKIAAYGLEEYVHLLGFRFDVSDLMQAFDVHVMTSFVEGLPMVAVEAQASGCPVVLSGNISSEALLLRESITIPLEESNQEWAERILHCASSSKHRDTRNELIEAGFDIRTEVARLLPQPNWSLASSGESKISFAD